MDPVLNGCRWMTEQHLRLMRAQWGLQVFEEAPGQMRILALGHWIVILASCPAMGIEYGIETILSLAKRTAAPN